MDLSEDGFEQLMVWCLRMVYVRVRMDVLWVICREKSNLSATNICAGDDDFRLESRICTLQTKSQEVL
jgi:hypothetical protein